MNLLSTISQSSPLRILAFPLNIKDIYHDASDHENYEDGEPDGWERACFGIFETGLGWADLAREVQDRPKLKEVAIGVITKKANGDDVVFDYIPDVFDRIHEIIRRNLVPLVTERIQVRIQEFVLGQF